MVAVLFFVAGLIAAASATNLVAREDTYFASLLKRQEPGTPAYNCHDNCGSAITLSRGADPCNNAAFVADYNNCLKCSGPDNYNIWRYYGGTLSSAGSKCGLDTEPVSGKKEDVPEAASTGAASSPAPVQTSAAAQSSTAASATPSAAPISSSTAAPQSSHATATNEAATSETLLSSALYTTATTPVVSSVHATAIANGTLSSSVSGVTSPSTNASATFTASAPAEITTNAAAGLYVADFAGVFGAIFVGALFGM